MSSSNKPLTKQEMTRWIFYYLDQGNYVDEIAEMLDIPDERVWQLIREEESREEKPGMEYYPRFDK